MKLSESKIYRRLTNKLRISEDRMIWQETNDEGYTSEHNNVKQAIYHRH